MKIHTAALVIAVGIGFYVGLTAVEWSLVLLAIGLVLGAELFNTAVERVCDAGNGKQADSGVKACKDIAAAAVLVAAVAAFIIGTIILVIPLVEKIF